MEKSIKTLELDRVLDQLAAEASLEDAKDLARSLRPMTDFGDVTQALRNTDDAYRLMARYAAPSFGTVKNTGPALARADVGASLSIRELLEVADLLRVIRSVHSWREQCDGLNELSVDPLFSSLLPNKFLEDQINFAIKNEEELNDNASPALSDLRRKIRNCSSKIRDSLDKIVRGPSARYLQEGIITQRDGRFVVPVRAEFKNELKGIVHDTSATGATLFVEPMAVVEINNEMRVLHVKEQEEIARILSELSAEVASFSDGIRASYRALVSLDFIFAKAKLSYHMGGIVPRLNGEGRVYLKRARHPLIPRKSVVPITVSLGKDYDTLIITGPNTGGKTVTLKTVGLLTLMTMCGLMIPVDDGSEICVFPKIFADIGDEQSIEQSLSTFSSHMVNIVSIMNECDENSLVLFDELCAGTDPIEGAALAQAILMELTGRAVKTVATTHYAELKSYALDTDRVENASCEFDLNTLKPTYRLIIGVPGRSNAFAISGRLGLDEAIINRAQEQISDDDLRFERVVASLEKARQAAEEEHREVTKLRTALAEQKRRAEQFNHELQLKQDATMEKTRQKAADLLDGTRTQAGQLLNELEEMKKQLNAENAAQLLEKARADYKKTVKKLEDETDPVREKNTVGEQLTVMPDKGDIVVIASFGRDATVLDTDEKGKRVYVMSGSMKLWVGLSELQLKKGNQSTEQRKTRRVTGMVSRAQREVTGEVDLRGMASDEAIMELDRYIDNSVLSGLTSVRIIHGKGTGVLRKAIQSHLRTHKCIESFRLGTFGEGENGVTIAELKQ